MALPDACSRGLRAGLGGAFVKQAWQAWAKVPFWRLASVVADALFLALQAVRAWAKAPLWLLASVVVEALFFVVYGFLTAPIKDKIIEHVLVIGGIVSQSAQTSGSRAVQSGQSVIALLLDDPQVRSYALRLCVLFVLLALASYAAYAFFQAVAWFFAHRRAGERMGWQDFIARFALLNVWWGVLFVLFSAGTLLVDIRGAVLRAMGQTSSVVPIVLLTVYVSVVSFVAIWSYALPLQESGRAGVAKTVRWLVRHPLRAILPAALVIVVFVAIDYGIVWLSSVSAVASLMVGGVLAVLAAAWARLYLVLVGKNVGA